VGRNAVGDAALGQHRDAGGTRAVDVALHAPLLRGFISGPQSRSISGRADAHLREALGHARTKAS
jgi:hypothetical protein